MIYLLCAAVVVLVGVVAGQAFRIAALDDSLLDFARAATCFVNTQHALNEKIKDKLRLVGQHID